MWGGSSEHATIQVPNIQPLCNFTLPIAPGARWEEFPRSASTAPKIPQAPAESTSCHWSFCSQTRSCWHIPPTHSTEEKNKTRNFLTSSFLFFFFFQKCDLLTWIMTSDYEEELLSLLNYCHAMSRFPRGGWSHVLRYEGYKHPIPALLCTTRLVLAKLILLKCPDWLNKTQFLF